MLKRSTWLPAVTMAVAGLITSAAYAADLVKPFILANSASGDVASVAASTKEKLAGAGFEVVGSYSPYAGVESIVFTSDELKSAATKSGLAVSSAITSTSEGPAGISIATLCLLTICLAIVTYWLPGPKILSTLVNGDTP